MTKLYVEDSGQRVSVAELAVITGKQQAVLGNFERDLVLRTAGSIKIQVGNKFYDLPLNDSDDDAVVSNSVTTILDKNSDLAGFTYSGDGQFVYVKESKSFYVGVDGSYTQILGSTDDNGETTTNMLFVSYNSAQALNGAQKQVVALNTGMFIKDFSELSGYTSDSTYANELIYNIANKKHYVLTDATNPASETSWSEIYLSIDGGTLNGRLTIGGTGRADSRLHIDGQYTGVNADSLQVEDAVFTMGEKDRSAGVGMWSNLTTYFQNFARNSRRGFKFITRDDDGNLFNPLTMFSRFVSLFGEPDYNFNLTVNGTSKQTGLAQLNKGVQDETYSPGSQGYTLTQDPIDSKWLLEVDKIKVRDQLIDSSKFDSKSIDGSYWSNPSLKVKRANVINEIKVYTLAHKLGNYRDNAGVKELIPFADKPLYALADTLVDPTDDSSARVVQSIELPWGFPDRDENGTSTVEDTYVKNADGSFSVLAGDYDLVAGEFLPTPDGHYIQSQSIKIVHITTDSVSIAPVGTLLYYASWNPDTTENDLFLAKVISVDDTSLIAEVYCGQNLTEKQELIVIGNVNVGVNSIHWNGVAEVDYIEQLDNIIDFRQLFTYVPYNDDGLEVLPRNTYRPGIEVTVNKMGDVSTLQDDYLELDGTGLYSSNAFMRGQFVSYKLRMLNIATTTTYYPFLLIDSQGDLHEIDLSSKITDWDEAYSWGDHAQAGYALHSEMITGDAATLDAAKLYTDQATTSVLRLVGTVDASTGTYPTTGSGTSSGIRRGDSYQVTVAGTIGSITYDVGDMIYALQANPGQVNTNWAATEHNLNQATETVRGTARVATQTTIENDATLDDITIVTPKKWWQGAARLLGIDRVVTGIWTFVNGLKVGSTTAFTSGGWLGIGTTTPYSSIHVEADTSTSITAGRAFFVDNATPSTSTGLGILSFVKTLPTAVGQRLGFITFGSLNNTTGSSQLNGTAIVSYASGAWTAASIPSYMSFETAPAGALQRIERMRIAADGKISLSNLAPTVDLDMTKAVNAPLAARISNTTNGAAAYAQYQILSPTATAQLTSLPAAWGTVTGIYQPSGSALDTNGAGGLSIAAYNTAGVIRFYTGANLAANERMRIDKDGNIGIGVTAPAVKLHLQGVAAREFIIDNQPGAATGGGSIMTGMSTLPTAAGIRLGWQGFGIATGAANYYTALMAAYSEGVHSATSTPTALSFETVPTGSTTRVERLRITSGGTIQTANDIEITDATKGIILRSPNGNRWRVTIDDSGTLVRTQL